LDKTSALLSTPDVQDQVLYSNCYTTLSRIKVYCPTTNDDFNSSSLIPVIFRYEYYRVNMPSKGGLISHVICLVYVPYYVIAGWLVDSVHTLHYSE